MKTFQSIGYITLFSALAVSAITALAADKKADDKLVPYTLDHCVVSDEKLGEMGKPYVTNYMGQEIKFCCPHCVKDFNKDPKKYLDKIAKEEKEKAAKK